MKTIKQTLIEVRVCFYKFIIIPLYDVVRLMFKLSNIASFISPNIVIHFKFSHESPQLNLNIEWLSQG